MSYDLNVYSLYVYNSNPSLRIITTTYIFEFIDLSNTFAEAKSYTAKNYFSLIFVGFDQSTLSFSSILTQLKPLNVLLTGKYFLDLMTKCIRTAHPQSHCRLDHLEFRAGAFKLGKLFMTLLR